MMEVEDGVKVRDVELINVGILKSVLVLLCV